ncbi:uncharacterized protein PV07_12653 [Cladophialophora immunda]|uniref:Uncharacterized protein n=1 Tax=Cladophialophora immunda TaxID=569365 RepID=A0A0D1Z2U6_9EURO|nr:uncharacterized protein PV07_12653 [Cladophialophora immunda]KIW21941.1 hypothetical protein PV07_12653 [Cladophialophora immunda]
MTCQTQARLNDRSRGESHRAPTVYKIGLGMRGYQELVRLREQWATHGQPSLPQIAPPIMPVLVFNLRSTDYFGPTAEWCSKKRSWVVKPFEKCQTASEYSIFLRQELEKYEVLLHQRQHRRRSRRKQRREQRPDFHSDAEAGSSSASADETSDEESLRARQRRQGRVVKRMEARVCKLMAQELEDAAKATRNVPARRYG